MKKALIITLFLISISTLSFSQEISGKVVDKETSRGISFANVGIEGSSVGTTTDEKGFFTLDRKSVV